MLLKKKKPSLSSGCSACVLIISAALNMATDKKDDALCVQFEYAPKDPLYVCIHFSSWFCDTTPLTLRIFGGGRCSAVALRPRVSKAPSKECVFLWFLYYKPVSNAAGTRVVLQHFASESIALTDGAWRAKKFVSACVSGLNIALSGTSFLRKLAVFEDRAKAIAPDTEKYARLYTEQLRKFMDDTFGKTQASVKFPDKTTKRADYLAVALRNTPYGVMPSVTWFQRLGTFAVKRLTQHADELVLNILHLITLSCPASVWDGVEDVHLLARVLLFIPRAVGPTEDAAAADEWTTPFAESYLSRVAVDCEELSGMTAIMCDVVRHTTHPSLAWMRELLAVYKTVHVLCTTRSGNPILTRPLQKAEENEQVHVATMLVPLAYWAHITGKEKLQRSGGPCLLLEGLTPACPVPCDTLDAHHYLPLSERYSADDGGTVSSKQMRDNKWYSSAFAMFTASSSDDKSRTQYMVAQKGVPGCGFFDLWNADVGAGISAHGFAVPMHPNFDWVADQSASFCSLHFDRAKALPNAQFTPSGKWMGVRFADGVDKKTKKKKPVAQSDFLYLCDNADALVLYAL